jgi:hypothetical protein
VVRERRAVGGEVVGQVLAEYRPGGGDLAGVGRAAVRGVAEAAGAADGPQHLRLDHQRRQLLEQAHVAAARQERVAGPGGRQAVVATCFIAQPPSSSEPGPGIKYARTRASRARGGRVRAA